MVLYVATLPTNIAVVVFYLLTDSLRRFSSISNKTFHFLLIYNNIEQLVNDFFKIFGTMRSIGKYRAIFKNFITIRTN